MGSLMSYFFESIESDEIDPATGLTESQKNLVRESWKTLQPNILQIGVETMITFFDKYPEYQEAFPKFRGRDLTELAKDRTFHAHCLGITGTFDQAIEFLHDAELCVAGLRMTGERHARRGQDVKSFNVLEPLMSKILKNWLGSECTSRASEPLDIALALIFREIKKGIDEYNESREKKTGSS